LAWTSFVYNYAVGGVIFIVGMLYAWRQGEVGLATKRMRRNTFGMLGGLLVIFGLQLSFMLLGSSS